MLFPTLSCMHTGAAASTQLSPPQLAGGGTTGPADTPVLNACQNELDQIEPTSPHK